MNNIKTIKLYYWKTDRSPGAGVTRHGSHVDYLLGIKRPTYNQFKKDYALVYAARVYAPESDLDICEDLYRQTNIGNADMILSQETARRVGHTSMSVGDIVKINTKYYICAIAGFDRIF